MQQPKRNIPVLLAVIILLFELLSPLSVHAVTNDNFDSASIILSLPFNDDVDISTATMEDGEPQNCAYSERTVWYSFTPTESGVVRADTDNSSFYDTTLSIYQSISSGFSGLNFINCTSYNNPVTFAVQAGTTYYLKTGSMYSVEGNLSLNLQLVPAPDNDDFNEAKPIAGLPFNDSVDTTGATLQTGEPSPPCAYVPLEGTVWYSYTATGNGPVSLSISAGFTPVVAVYSGNGLSDLTEMGCQIWGPLTFQANAGVVYYIQIGSLYGPGGWMQFSLDVTPAPVANFYFYPQDPSTYDTIQFYDQSYDPGQIGFETAMWDFGDGETASDCCPIHRYANDNDYTVKLTVTTLDGRTSSASQVVQVRSHDVAIGKFAAPQSASVGQTRQLTVGIDSKLYADKVQVQLLKSVPGAYGGFETVGTLTQYVPERSGGRTTNFKFSYTFTPADAGTGKVTFKAVALIEGYRDVLPADNEAITLPTKVK